MPSKVLLIGWDSADWKVIQPLMDAGKMPNVARLVREGASGPIATLHPPLSPMLWTSIATGKRPYQHGIHGFTEPAPDGSGIRPVTNLSRKAKALWNILNQNGRRSTVIGWWPSHPAEPIDGVMVSDQYHRARGPAEEGWPLVPHTVHPAELAETLARLRVHPDSLEPPLVERFIPLAREIDQDRDKRLGVCLRTLAEAMTVQAAAIWLIENRPWDFFAAYYVAIDHFSHAFMKYHPPRQSWVHPRDFELYRNAVSMAYQFHDEMLGALVAKAGGNTTVILMSDHGFHPDHLRPVSIPNVPAGPAIEHRDFGVLAMRGPAIQAGRALHGASVLDVAPTILTLCGFSVGQDMDGKVLSRAFAEPPRVTFVPSWEDIPGADGRHPSYTRLDPAAAHEALEQMIALGYIERPAENREAAIAATVRELRYNLGQAYQDAGRHLEAYEILSGLCREDADEQRFAVALFVSCQALGKRAEMRRIVDDLDGRRRALCEEAKERLGEPRQDTPEEDRGLERWRRLARFEPAVIDYLKAQVWMAERRYADALDALEQVSEASLLRPGLFLQKADLYRRLGRPDDARQVYEQALAIDPDNAQAHIGLCRMALRRRQYGAAAHAALDALQRVYDDPLAHYLLGRALEGAQEYERAAEAYRAAIAVNPHFPQAHVRLAGLLERHLGDPAAAAGHRRLASGMRDGSDFHPLPAAVAERAENRAPVSAAAGMPMPPPAESLIVVTGLPRSGTSMLMQMLAAGGVPVLADDSRAADEDNPRGYLEFEPVKKLLRDSQWLAGARGKAVKIVAPLLAALPPGLPCRVILCERDLDEVLDSQGRMLRRRDPAARSETPERRRMLKAEYRRTLDRVRAMLARRAGTQLLVVEHAMAMCDARATADQINAFLGGGKDAARMAAAVDPALHRNRAATAAFAADPTPTL